MQGPVDPQAEFLGWMKQYSTYQEFFNNSNRHFTASDAKAFLWQNGDREGAAKLLQWQRKVRNNLRRVWTMALPVGEQEEQEGQEGQEQAPEQPSEQAPQPPAPDQAPPPEAQEPQGQTGPLPVANVQGNQPQIQPQGPPAQPKGGMWPPTPALPAQSEEEPPMIEEPAPPAPPAQPKAGQMPLGPQVGEQISKPEGELRPPKPQPSGPEAYSGEQGNPYDTQDVPRNKRPPPQSLEPTGEVGGFRAKEESWLRKRREKEKLEAELAELEAREKEKGEKETAEKKRLQQEINEIEAEAAAMEAQNEEPTEQIEYEEAPKKTLKSAPPIPEDETEQLDTSEAPKRKLKAAPEPPESDTESDQGEMRPEEREEERNEPRDVDKEIEEGLQLEKQQEEEVPELDEENDPYWLERHKQEMEEKERSGSDGQQKRKLTEGELRKEGLEAAKAVFKPKGKITEKEAKSIVRASAAYKRLAKDKSEPGYTSMLDAALKDVEDIDLIDSMEGFADYLKRHDMMTEPIKESLGDSYKFYLKHKRPDAYKSVWSALKDKFGPT